MSIHKNIVSKHAGSPYLLLYAAAGLTISFWVGYRYAYAPWSRRNKLMEAEECANYLYNKKRSNEE